MLLSQSHFLHQEPWSRHTGRGMVLLHRTYSHFEGRITTDLTVEAALEKGLESQAGATSDRALTAKLRNLEFTLEAMECD